MATSMRAARSLLRRAGLRPCMSASRYSQRWIASSATRGGFVAAGDGGNMQGWPFLGKRFPLSSSVVSPALLSRVGQQRSMFIQTQSTPNPQSLMFYPGKEVMGVGSSDFPNARVGMQSPLAKALFRIDGVTRVFFGSEFVTVTKADELSWDILKPEIFAAIMDFYTAKQPLFYDAQSHASDTAINEEDDETVAMIKELLETRIRPAVQDDGGDIEYRGFDLATGIVKLKMQGACSGCPSSAVTLKSGIENMLMHYVPEVKGVEEAHDSDSDDEEEKISTNPGG